MYRIILPICNTVKTRIIIQKPPRRTRWTLKDPLVISHLVLLSQNSYQCYLKTKKISPQRDYHLFNRQMNDTPRNERKKKKERKEKKTSAA